MWRILFIVLQIVLLVVLFRTAPVQNFFGNLTLTVSGWFSSVSELPQQQRLSTIRQEFFHNNVALKDYQVDYVSKITEDVKSIQDFYANYCNNDDKNPYIYGANLVLLCDKIRASALATM